MFVYRDENRLPPFCYSVDENTNCIIFLKRYEKYNEPFRYGRISRANMSSRELADALNAEYGISKSEEKAMYFGAMNSWDADEARPDYYENFSTISDNCEEDEGFEL